MSHPPPCTVRSCRTRCLRARPSWPEPGWARCATGRWVSRWGRPDCVSGLASAFGLWAAASPAQRFLVAGAELADSWAADAHKWLNVPYDCGLAIVRDPAALGAALGKNAAYLPASDVRDPFNFTPEASRRARALPVYAALRSLGRRGVAELIDRCCALARLAAAELASGRPAAVLNDAALNQLLFRVP